MLFSEFKGYLAYGELSQLNIGELVGDTTHYPKIVSAINLGLIELYTRFPIKKSEVVIQLAEHITNYVIHSSHAESNMPVGANPTYYYVKDSVYYPFLDDIISIESIWNEDGMELPLNDENLQYSLFTSSHNAIHHPYPDNENAITVIYRGLPIKLDTITDNTDIDIPQQLAEPLINYVAYRMFAAINMNSAEAVNYYAKFEASVASRNNLGLIHKSSNTNMRLENNGWV